ncbi:MAG: tetratricopeptide repeat protein [Polyangiaceae bacterium]|nr:tetratricopeptide repeat protein [Polyangiaceae bacterium]
MLAQSAADKATARTLATAGIEAFEAGKYADALDKVSRAQALYDAPIHLLYIARAQEKLGRLVEAAETYRKLERVKLDASAPTAFVQAQTDGQRELTALLPRLPSLRIEIEPAGIEGLVLKLDGVELSSAVIGVDRPSNPGERVIEASAPGYSTAQRKVNLVERQKLDLKIELKPDGTPFAAPGSTPKPNETGAAKDVDPPPDPPPSVVGEGVEDKGFYVAIHLGGAVPIGDIGKHPVDESSIPISDQFQPGGGGELRGGYRFAKYFTPFLMLEGYNLKAGTLFNSVVTASDTQVETTTYATGAGLGLMVGTQPGDFGFYGEVGLLLHQMTANMTVTHGSEASCENSMNYSGTGFRLGGGMQIPVTGAFRVEPFMTFTMSRFDTVTAERDERCDVPTVIGGLGGDPNYDTETAPGFGSRLVDEDRYDLQDDEKALHILLVVGVGIGFSQF